MEVMDLSLLTTEESRTWQRSCMTRGVVLLVCHDLNMTLLLKFYHYLLYFALYLKSLRSHFELPL